MGNTGRFVLTKCPNCGEEWQYESVKITPSSVCARTCLAGKKGAEECPRRTPEKPHVWQIQKKAPSLRCKCSTGNTSYTGPALGRSNAPKQDVPLRLSSGQWVMPRVRESDGQVVYEDMK
jgi:hypothetical protein